MLRLASSFALCLVASLASAQPRPPVASRTLDFPSGSETISGVLARPVDAEPERPHKGKAKPVEAPSRPAILLVQEWWGVNDFLKQKAEHFARLGYVVLAPDLYRGQVASDPDTAHQLSRGMPHDRALRDLSAGIDALLKQPGVDSKRIAVVGWCMGGGLANELSTVESRLKATVVYYGAVPSDRMQISRIKAAYLGNFGAEDRGIPVSDVRAFETQLKKQGNPVDIKVYPGAGHAFASSSKPEVYKKEAAADADQRTDDFLAKWLKP